MDERAVKDWLGKAVADDPRPLLPEIVEGMAEVPFPEDWQGHMAAFIALLSCLPDFSSRNIFATDVQQWLGSDGTVFEARRADPPTARLADDGRVHQLEPPQRKPIRPRALCGRWALGPRSEIPGRDPVDCPACLRELGWRR